MSVMILENAHIDALVSAASEDRDFGWNFQGGQRKIESGKPAQRTAVGRMLVKEMYASFNTRYKDQSKVPPYMFQYSLGWTPVEIIKACDCYAYQACESMDWDESEAKAFINSLRRAQCHKVPGYEKAPWDIREAKSNAVPLMSLIGA